MSFEEKDRLVYDALTNWEAYQAQSDEKARRFDEAKTKRGSWQEQLRQFHAQQNETASAVE